MWSLLNLSNIYIWRNVGGYWGDSAASVPLLHTWSLAIEEQFYVLFPVTLVVAVAAAATLLDHELSCAGKLRPRRLSNAVSPNCGILSPPNPCLGTPVRCSTGSLSGAGCGRARSTHT